MVAKSRALPAEALRTLDTINEQGPLRFTEIQERLDISESTLDRALKALAKEVLVAPLMSRTSRRKGVFEYTATRRGKALLRYAHASSKALHRERRILGDLVEELDPLHA
jgi:DNA-binding HxlR family transcriptional regulator